jgi:WD40 repeat protein
MFRGGREGTFSHRTTETLIALGTVFGVGESYTNERGNMVNRNRNSRWVGCAIWVGVALLGVAHTARADSTPTAKKIAEMGNNGFFHKSMITDILPHPNGKHVLTSTTGGMIYVWDIATRKRIRQFRINVGPLNRAKVSKYHLLPEAPFGLRFSADGKFFYVVHDRTGIPFLLRYEWKTGKLLDWTQLATQDNVTLQQIVLVDDQHCLVAYPIPEAGGVLILWNLKTKKSVWEQPFNHDDVHSIVVSKDNRVWVGMDDSVCEISMADGEVLRKYDFSELQTLEDKFPEEDTQILYYVVSAHNTGLIQLADNQRFLAATMGNKTFYIDTQKNEIDLERTSTGSYPNVAQAKALPGWYTGDLGYARTRWKPSPDGKTLWIGVWNRLYGFDKATGKRIYPQETPDASGAVKKIHVLNNEKRLLVEYRCGTVLLWDMKTKKRIPHWIDTLSKSPGNLSYFTQDKIHAVDESTGKIFLRLNNKNLFADLNAPLKKNVEVNLPPIPPWHGSPYSGSAYNGIPRYTFAQGKILGEKLTLSVPRPLSFEHIHIVRQYLWIDPAAKQKVTLLPSPHFFTHSWVQDQKGTTLRICPPEKTPAHMDHLRASRDGRRVFIAHRSVAFDPKEESPEEYRQQEWSLPEMTDLSSSFENSNRDDLPPKKQCSTDFMEDPWDPKRLWMKRERVKHPKRETYIELRERVATQSKTPAVGKTQIAAWIEELSSDSYKIRIGGMKRLKAIHPRDEGFVFSATAKDRDAKLLLSKVKDALLLRNVTYGLVASCKMDKGVVYDILPHPDKTHLLVKCAVNYRASPKTDLYRIDGKKIIRVGSLALPANRDCARSTLLSDGTLLIGTDDGRVKAYAINP